MITYIVNKYLEFNFKIYRVATKIIKVTNNHDITTFKETFYDCFVLKFSFLLQMVYLIY